MTSAIGLSASAVTNLYLYGTRNRPTDLTDEGLAENRNTAATTAVDVNQYLNVGPGRFANPSIFPVVQMFFDNNITLEPNRDPITGNVIPYLEVDLARIFGVVENVNLNQAALDPNSSDYAERVFIWNLTSFDIADNSQFWVLEDGTREIRNLAIVPFSNDNNQENFDFVSSGLLAQLGNPLLENIVDPSRLGIDSSDDPLTVSISFSGTSQRIQQFTRDNFLDAQEATVEESNLALLTLVAQGILGISPVDRLVESQLFNPTNGSIRFLDDEERPILYGTEGSDDFFSFGNVTTVEGISLSSHRFLRSFLSNGVQIIAGDGNDELGGTISNDLLRGGAGMDTLLGGPGNDIFIGGSGDDDIRGSGIFDGMEDVAIYSGNYDEYTIEHLADGTIRITDNVANRDGVDILTAVEFAQFADKRVELLGPDISFVIDVSGSFADNIAAVQNELSTLLDQIFGTPDNPIFGRLSIVTFNDIGQFRTLLSFTDQGTVEERRVAAEQSINNLRILGGGVEPLNAAGISALDGSAGDWNFDNPRRGVIIVTDEPAGDPQLRSDLIALSQNINMQEVVLSSTAPSQPSTFNAILSNVVANQINDDRVVPVPIFPVVVGNNPAAIADLQMLADATNGQLFQALDSSVLVEAVTAAIGSVANGAPVDAQDDNFSILESEDITTTLFVDNGNGPDTPQGVDNLEVSAVNDDPSGVDAVLVTEAGATLIVGSDGSISYESGGALDFLRFGETLLEEFTYTISNDLGESDTATVSIEVIGQGTSVSERQRDLLVERNLRSTISGSEDGGVLNFGTDEDDVVAGSNRADVIFGRMGDDRIVANGGADFIFGDQGNDTIVGGGGRDSLAGGEGRDRLDGSGGNDILLGGAGNDTLFGRNGADEFDDGFGNDRIIAGNGSDTVFLRAGNDLISLGRGSDTIIVEGLGFGMDQITDFRPGQNDRLDFRSLGLSSEESLALAVQVENDVVFEFASGDRIVLENLAIDALTIDNFVSDNIVPMAAELTAARSGGLETFSSDFMFMA